MDTALFSPSSLFLEDEDKEEAEHQQLAGSDQEKLKLSFVERTHDFPAGMKLIVREFSFHQLNANLLWPGTFSFAEWLTQRPSLLKHRRIIELGSGTGALAIYLARSLQVDITTSDFDDQDIEDNIAHNCRVNSLPVLPHIRHSWGDSFPFKDPEWDLVIASDILLYVKQYDDLIRTLSFLLTGSRPRHGDSGSAGEVLPFPAFLMSWRRRIGKEEEASFFTKCKNTGLTVHHLGSRVYCISPFL